MIPVAACRASTGDEPTGAPLIVTEIVSLTDFTPSLTVNWNTSGPPAFGAMKPRLAEVKLPLASKEPVKTGVPDSWVHW